MKRLILLLALLALAPTIGQVYEVQLYQEQEIYTESIALEIAQSNPALAHQTPTLTVTVKDKTNRALVEENFIFSNEFVVCGEEGCTTHQHTRAVLYVPYASRGEILTITDLNTGQEITRNITHLSNYCGNNICSPPDNPLSCPQDCLSVIEEPQTPSHAALFMYVAVGLVILILILVAIKFTQKKRRPSAQ